MMNAAPWIDALAQTIRTQANARVLQAALKIVSAEGVELLEVECDEDGLFVFALVFEAPAFTRQPPTEVKIQAWDDGVHLRFATRTGDDLPPDAADRVLTAAAAATIFAAQRSIIASSRSAYGHEPHSVISQPPPPAWQRELGAFAHPVRAAEAQPRCLFVSIRHQTLAVRPGILGARGRWIRGTARWETGRADPQAPADRRALHWLWRLADLEMNGASDGYTYSYGYARTPVVDAQGWLALDQVPAHQLWPAIAQLQDAHVALVDTTGEPVQITADRVFAQTTVESRGSQLNVHARFMRVPAASPTADASVADASDLQNAQILPSEQVFPIGDPTVLVAIVPRADAPAAETTGAETTSDEATGNEPAGIIFARADPEIPADVAALAKRTASLRVAADERTQFVEQYLPNLVLQAPVVSPDQSFSVPAPVIDEIVLTVTVDPSSHTLWLAWKWQRSRPAELRDAARDRALLARVHEVLAEAEDVVGGGRRPDQLPADIRLTRDAGVVFIGEVLPRLRGIDGLVVREASPLPSHALLLELPEVLIGSAAEDDNDWFDLNVQITVRGQPIAFGDLFSALAQGDRVFVLPDGSYFPLTDPQFDQLRALLEEARLLGDWRPGAVEDAPSLRLNRYQVGLWDELVDLDIVTGQEADWWLRMHDLTDPAQTSQAPEPPVQAVLRPYQRQGYEWLWYLWQNRLGGVLADDMGLGKTLQTIALIASARAENAALPPFLVLAPTSVVGNWVTEIAAFAPQLRVVALTETSRRRGTTLQAATADADVVVTSYQIQRLEASDFQAAAWAGIVLDEAQSIKNAASQSYRAVRDLDAAFTLVVTGTPLENSLGELWALVSLACPGLLGSRERFREFYRRPIEKDHDPERLAKLQRRLKPFLLRRSKAIVAADLPPKQERTIEVDLHPRHRAAYLRQLQRERQRVLGLLDDAASHRFEIFRSLTLLRQLALDPALVAEPEASDDPPIPSAKLERLRDLVVEASAEGHRILVLSQFTRFLARARSVLTEAGIRSAYLDGTSSNRQRIIDDFRHGDAPVFLISLKAGGFGLNLVEADSVVLLDPWWNPAVEEQAIDRTHRIGQQRPVMVYRLIAADTVEAKVVKLKQKKAELFSRVFSGVGDIGTELQRGELTLADLRDLLSDDPE